MKPASELYVELPEGYGLTALSTAINGPHEVTVCDVTTGATATASDPGSLRVAVDLAVAKLFAGARR